MSDTCTLIPEPSLTAQGAGHTLAPATEIPDVPCNHEQLGGGGVQFNEGGSTVTKTHKVTLPYTDETVLINRHYKIKIAARGFNPEMIFEQPVRTTDGLSPFLSVFCVLTEGYRAPGFA